MTRELDSAVRRRISVAAGIAVLLVAFARLEPPVHGGPPPSVELVSVGTDGVAAAWSGSDASSPGVPRNKISADGRYVVFESFAGNLVCDDHNFSSQDVFVRDRLTGTTTLVSLAWDGAQGNGNSYDPVISANGRFVAFNSGATNLVPGDTNGFEDVYVRDLEAGTTTRVSLTSAGGEPNSVSHGPAISGDGRYVVYYSNADNLVPGDVNSSWDVFLRDLQAGTTERISGDTAGIACCGGDTPTISDDGRYVAFISQSWLDQALRNSFREIFVRDRMTGATTMASLTEAGLPEESGVYWGFISPGGRHVVFESYSADVVTPKTNGNGTHDIFLRDLVAGTTTLISQSSAGERGNHDSALPTVSADGRFVAFHSWANNLVPGDTSTGVQYDVFLRDTLLGTTTRVNVGMGGAEADGESKAPSISQDGSLVYFQSTATNLVPNGHPPGYQDVFVYGPPYPGAAAPGLRFDALPYVAGEAAGTATVTVVRNGPTCTTATVDYATTDGSAAAGVDYAATSGTLTFLPGETAHTFAVPILDDLLDEPAETFRVTLSRPTGGAPVGVPSVATVTIADDDPPPNTPPHAMDDAGVTSEDTPVTIDVLMNDFDADGDPLTLSAYTPAAHGAVVANADGTMTYAPAPDFSGADAFTYTIADGHGGSATATVRVDVTAINDAPVAADDAYGVVAGETLAVGAPGVLANDSDVDGVLLSAALAAGPMHGAVALDGDGSFTYAPVAGFVGDDTFTYTAQDGIAGSNVATVKIVVTGVAIKPVIGTITPIPGGTGTFTGFPGGPGLGSAVALFLGTGNGGQLGLYLKGTTPQPPPLKLADLATSIPNGSGTFSAIGDFSLAGIPGDPCREAAFLGAGAGGQQGLYLSAVCATTSSLPPPIRLTDLSTAIPSGVGAFTALRDPHLVAQPGDPCREAAFLGTGVGQQGVYLAASCDAGTPEPPPSRIADLGTAIPSGTGTFTAFTALALVATPGDPCREAAFVGAGASGQRGVYLAASCGAGSPPPPPIRLADANTPIPGGHGTFTGFDALSMGATLAANAPPLRVVFIGAGSAGQRGVYAVSAGQPNPPPVKIADVATAIPQGDGTFTGFVAVSASGAHSAFLATGAGGQKGLYLASTLTKIVDLTDRLDGKALADLRFGADGLSGNALVFTAVFADGSEGVYHATLDLPGVDDPPVAADDSYRTPRETALVVAAPGVLSNDEDVDGASLAAILVAGPSHGTIGLAADGSFTYTPGPAFVGVDAFQYKVTDGANESNVARVTVTVEAAAPPIARDDAFLALKNLPRIVPAPGVVANDTSPSGAPLTAALVRQPGHGFVLLLPNGAFLYFPSANFVGTDAFLYKTTDGAGASNVAKVTMIVLGKP